MKPLCKIVFLLFQIITATVSADSQLPLAVEAKFVHAVNLLDEYRGNTVMLEMARERLNEVLQADESYAPAYREYARYFIMRGHIRSLLFQPGALETADALLTKSLEINPQFAEAYVLQGHLFRLMERHQEALDALEKAEQLGSNDPWLQNNWADLLIDENRFEAAAARYTKVINGETEFANKKAMGAAFNGLIRYYLNTGDIDKADEIYRKEIDYEPGAAWTYGSYAYFLRCYKDDFENSVAQSRKALARMDYGLGRVELASGLYRQWSYHVLNGHPEKGERFYQEAQSIYPNVKEILADTDRCPPMVSVKLALTIRDKNLAADSQQ